LRSAEDSVIADGHDAFLPSLPSHLRLLAHQIQIAHGESLQLGEPHPRGVEQLEDGEVAHRGEIALHRARLGHLKEEIDLGAVEITR
jgi:hypothetical protein